MMPHPSILRRRPSGRLLLALGLLCLSVAALPAAPVEPEQHRRGERVSIFSGDIHIPANVYQDGPVFCLGGDVVVEGRVRNEIIVVGGSLRMTGETRSSVIGILADLHLDGAYVGDQLINIAGTLDDRNTEIDGQFVNIAMGDWFGGWSGSRGIFGLFVFWGRMLRLFFVFILLLLLAAIVPERIRVIADEAPVRYATAFFVGLLGYLGMLLVVVLLLVTVIGVPIAILLFGVLKWLGMAGIFLAIGRRLGRSFGREMSLLGAILLVFAPFLALMLAPAFFGLFGFVLSFLLCTLIWLFVEVPAIGLVLLTRAGAPSGTSHAPPHASPAPPAPPLDPQPPAAPVSSPPLE